MKLTSMWFWAIMVCTVHEMAWITNTRQSQTSSEENSNQRMGQTWTFGYTRGGIMWARSRTSTGAESLEYFIGSSWPFDIYHRYWQELRCYCDIRCWSGTLLWGRPVWRHLLLVSSVKQVCLLSRPEIIEVGPAKNSFLLLLHTGWGQTSVQKRHLYHFPVCQVLWKIDCHFLPGPAL
jgi:hypothetical protein